MNDPSTTADMARVGRPAVDGMSVVEVDGTLVAIAPVDDGYLAFDDTCTHRECPLSEGVFDGTTVTCPCHKSRFDARTGESLNGPATVPIRTRRVIVDGETLLIER